MLTNLYTHKKRLSNEEGFTLVELMIVVVIIGILAAVAIPIFANQQKAAIDGVSKAHQKQLQQAIEVARIKTNKTLLQITGAQCTGCAFAPDPTDPLDLPKTHGGWVRYNASMKAISDASGVDVTRLLDGHGRPLLMDENEGENGSCGRDLLAIYKDPYTGYSNREYGISLPAISVACR